MDGSHNVEIRVREDFVDRAERALQRWEPGEDVDNDTIVGDLLGEIIEAIESGLVAA